MAKQAKKRQRPSGRRRRPGYWQQWNNVERELHELEKKLGHFPTPADLRRHNGGLGGLRKAITKRHGGYATVAKKCGVFIPKRPDRREWKYIKRELQAWIKEHEKFPTERELRCSGKGRLAAAITQHHGGFHTVRTRLGFSPNKRPRGYWDDETRIACELRIWIKRSGEFPKIGQLLNNHRHALVVAISRNGGFRKWRERLGHAQSLKPPGYWDKKANIKRELQAWIKEHGKFPTYIELCRTKHSGLASAMSRSGGFSAWRVRLGYHALAKPDGYWDNKANIKRELQAWIKEHGKFPTQEELTKTRNTSLAGAIIRNAGIHSWRKLLGYEISTKPPGYWDKKANIKRELQAWIKEHGKFPTQRDLQRSNSNGLAHGIQKHGGIQAWRARLGYGRPIHNTSGFVRMLEREQPQKARRVLKDLMSHFGDDLVDVADILAVVYTGRLDSQAAMEILQDPTMRPWIVPFDGKGHGPGKPPIGDDFPFYLLEKDRNGVIAGIIRRRLTEWRRKVLGARPSKEARERFLRELRAMQERLAKGGNQVALAAE